MIRGEELIMYALNQLPLRDMSKSVTGCCAPFDPIDWDGKTFKFKDKLFLKFKTRSLFHIPLNMSSVMKRVMAQVEEAGAATNENLMLSDEVSPWKAEHYLAVIKDVPGADMASLNGTFLAKVFEGDYKEMRNWYQQLVQYAESKGSKPIKNYFSYTMCPSCAKVYGKNYVVGFAQVGVN